jgi:hypothetical protein
MPDFGPGCFVACLLGEECCQSEIIRKKLDDLLQIGDRICAKSFERMQDQLNPALSPEAAGRLLVCTIDGVALRARAGVSKETLLAICESFVDMVVAA